MTDSTGDDKKTISALEYLEDQEKLEKDASAILPGKFETCTFSLGYIRQPLYACKTCAVENHEPAGICYSCSIACHPGHELYELFPKRQFRCDCGLVGKFKKQTCSLMVPSKKLVYKNEENQYNHNFEGRYCRCDQYYCPEKEENTMYQCIACEDWFHETCIGNIPEVIEDFDCYLCRDCTKKYPFLLKSNDSRFSFGLSKGNGLIDKWILPEEIDVVSNDPPSEAVVADEAAITTDVTSTSELPNLENTIEQAQLGEKRKATESPVEIIPNCFKRVKSETNCQNVNTSLFPEHDHIETFLQESWREGLCKCTECLKMYKDQKVTHLLSEEKTYEPEEDEDAGKSLMDVAMEQLQRMDRVTVIESLMAYKSLAADMKMYLKKFEETGKVVTKEDIEEFFDAKRQEKGQ